MALFALARYAHLEVLEVFTKVETMKDCNSSSILKKSAQKQAPRKRAKNEDMLKV